MRSIDIAEAKVAKANHASLAAEKGVEVKPLLEKQIGAYQQPERRVVRHPACCSQSSCRRCLLSNPDIAVIC